MKNTKNIHHHHLHHHLRQYSHQHGQALIELIVFLPLMFMLYSMISGFANAINGSINQQKVTRAYFYYRIQNNSTIPKPDDDKTFLKWGMFGMFYIGWKDYFQDQRPVAPCYKITIPLSAGAKDKCEESYNKATTQFIRVGTVYGLCGATYQKVNGDAVPVPDLLNFDYSNLIKREGCLIGD